MTSSLVGSEMCIRDSSITMEARVNGAPKQQSGMGGTVRGKPRTPGWQAVSYTHLTLPTICSV
eukprot:11625195-Prorocentrum_lima.AAC.1